MKKKCIKLLLLFVISCSIAYLIGQKAVLPLTEKKSAQNDQQSEQSNTELYDIIKNFSDLSLRGQSATDDNPWGSNLTTFEDEEHGTCILMTPDTEISVQHTLQGQAMLNWSANIHPWMSGISDGAEFTVTVQEAGADTQGITEKVKIVPADAYEQGSISLAEFQNTKIQVTLSVNNGDNNDSSGDWLVFDRLEIAYAARD